MPDILLETSIATAPEQVFRALTEQPGLAAWWTPQIVAEPKVGALVEASFRGGQFVTRMEVAGLETDRKVEWIPRQAVPEWSGTRVTWDLSPDEQGTKVLFGQRGFASAAPDGSLPGANGWAFYLDSLKDYLETGQGRPGAFTSR